MNGRLYDPVLGRFISADPYIQDASDGQGFNRYSYVNNNPLSFTDPSGYWSFKKFLKASFKFSINPSPKNTFEYIRNQPGQQAVDRYIMTHRWAYAVGQAAATFFTTAVCGGCGGAAWASYYGYVATGSVNSALRTGAITYATTYAFSYVNGSGLATPLKVVTNGVIGGVSAELQGGSFGDGFKFSFGLSAVTTAARYTYNSIAGYDVSIKPGDGLASPKGNYEFTKDGLIPLNSAGNMPGIMGLNEPLVNTGNTWNDFWTNFGKQGSFPGTILNYILPAGNAIGVLHDSGWGPNPAYFNTFTNWGTMLPAAALTYGALLNNTYLMQAVIQDRVRK